ncbi:Uracil-regulated protein 1 [Escovopsis weberi]|uniref:Uracil-regulated protein 1 n=1 Tax=Escovopsis weberi TaxID=150374 RepID=A0A0M8MZ37_ESCWE|nr:Uracil-regulated protein 1 [Escovopsis weberi]
MSLSGILAIGAHGGSYSIYYALAVASKELDVDHRSPSLRKASKAEGYGKVCLNELGELSVTKIAVEPVWYLPGVAERFGIDEGTLRQSLFEHTGGSYPELITRGDIKLFLPPIGGLTVYCFGDPAKMSDESVRLSLRIHDEYLVYNARKRGADKASEYFQRTENIAGVKDMRFQALMPDILHWLGIKKIDRMLSMSK